jgi:hypothetical protein
MKRYSVGLGPKGGIEYREWTGEDTYRVRSKFQIWHLLSQQQQEWASNKAAELKAAKDAKAENNEVWRRIMAGG